MKHLLLLLLTLLLMPSLGMSAGELVLVDRGEAKARIVLQESASETEKFAAAELQHYLGLMTATDAARVTVPMAVGGDAAKDANANILIGRALPRSRIASLCEEQNIVADEATLGSDGYVIRTATQKDGRSVLLLTAATERGVLFAAYHLLETLGVRFFGYRERDGECVPHRDTVSVPALDVREKPAMRYRFVSDNNFGAADKSKLTNVADWAAKNRCNVFMLTPSRAGETWSQIALDEVRKRGLMIAGPGHVLAQFTPERSLFAAHPEYFPLLKGERIAKVSEAWGGVPSFCWSNEEAMRLVVAKAMRYLAAAPFIDLFAVYPPDGSQRGSQCQCERCARMTMSDWYLTLMNRIAQECAAEFPTKKVMWIAYNECGVVPTNVKPWQQGKNMVLLWCNDIRDFRSPMDSETNRLAASYLALKPRLITIKTDGKKSPADTDLAAWHRWQSWSAFLKRSGYAGDVVLLDYYNAHVGNSLQVPMLRHCQSGPWPDGLMQRDFQTYVAQGITGWQNCTDYYNDSPHPYWNRLAARLMWNPREDLSALDADFYTTLYGAAGDAMRRYYDALWHTLALDESAQRPRALEALAQQLAAAETSLPKPLDSALAKRLKAARDFHQRLVK